MECDANNKIVSCTISELFNVWLKDWSDVVDFYTYKDSCIELGVTIIEEDFDMEGE